MSLATWYENAREEIAMAVLQRVKDEREVSEDDEDTILEAARAAVDQLHAIDQLTWRC